MGFFSNFFSGKSKGEDDKPAIYGGDGLTKHAPAIINCGSIPKAAISRVFISIFLDQ